MSVLLRRRCFNTKGSLIYISEDNVVVGSYISDSGAVLTDANNFYCTEYIGVEPSSNYRAFFSTTLRYFSVSEYNSNKGFIVRTLYQNMSDVPFTTRSNTRFIRIDSNMYTRPITLEDVLGVNWVINKV